MNQRQKPVAKLIGENGNIFNLLGIASRALKEAGQHEQAAKMFEEIKGCGSYENALAIIADYVEVEYPRQNARLSAGPTIPNTEDDSYEQR